MSTTAEKLAYLMGTKTGIRDEIISKGVDVPDTTVFREYIDKIGLIKDGDIIVSGLVYVPGTPTDFTLTGWDAATQGTTYTLEAQNRKIGVNGLQLGIPVSSSVVNTQAIVEAALTIVDSSFNEDLGTTTITLNAVNVPSQDIVISIFGLEEVT